MDHQLHSSGAGAAEYSHAIRTCYVEFQEPSAEFDVSFLIGWYACVLVHEATHGVLRSHGIGYTPELRERIERLCVREEQRFVHRLCAIDPNLAARLAREFDARDWHWHWHTPHLHRCFRQFCRSFAR